MRLARVAVDLLRPVPVGTLTARTRTVRAGKRVALLETVLESAGREVLQAKGWRIATSGDAPVITRGGEAPPMPGSEAAPTFPGGHLDGYMAAIDWRFAFGSFDQPGPSQAWGRARIPLIEGEELSPMSRTLLIGDSGSGVSSALDPSRYLFINVDLTVVLHRDPVGEWILLDALTTMGGTGTGLAETLLSDQSGVCGTGMQTLLIAPR